MTDAIVPPPLVAAMTCAYGWRAAIHIGRPRLAPARFASLETRL